MTFLIQQTMLFAVPLMIVALAGVFSERSGIINLALCLLYTSPSPRDTR